jgi:cell division protein ZapE
MNDATAVRKGEGDDPITRRYEALLRAGEIESDPHQRSVVSRLDRLSEAITRRRLARKTSALGWIFARGAPRELIRGVYIHGSVGRGKTMLMDLFFKACQADRKRRAHFNEFMADAHARIHAHRQAFKAGQTREEDPVPPVARALASEAWVLCFDEFSVTDIADAMILSRLFTALFAEGIVLVATSNIAPADLYRDGLNRKLFTPFLDILHRHLDVISLDGDMDHRIRKLGRLPVYMTPLGPGTDLAMDHAFDAATGGATVAPAHIEIRGRKIAVPAAARGVARFSFASLCEQPLAAADYLAIAGRYDTIFLDRVPILGPEKRNEAKRFILLIDTLYDKRRRLVVSAEAEPGALYQGKAGTEAFEFARTISRLEEMRSEAWNGAAQREQRG